MTYLEHECAPSAATALDAATARESISIFITDHASGETIEFSVPIYEAFSALMEEYLAMVMTNDPSIARIEFLIEGQKVKTSHTPYDWDLQDGDVIHARRISAEEAAQHARLMCIREVWETVPAMLQKKLPVSKPKRNVYEVAIERSGISIFCPVPGCGAWLRVSGAWYKDTYVPNLCNYYKHWIQHDLEHMQAKVTDMFCVFSVCSVVCSVCVLCHKYPYSVNSTTVFL